MGEHWVNLARVMADTLDPAMPPVLIYVMVNGAPQLGGVAFTDLLGRGESVGRVPGARFWHEHNGSITEESFPLQHHMGLSRAGAGDDLRLAILHVWTNISNPAGPFATDNWTLPARRLALRDNALDSTASRAAALAEDASGYYALMLETALHPSRAEHLAIDSVLSAARADARARVAALRAGRDTAAPRRVLGIHVEGARSAAASAGCRAASVAERVVASIQRAVTSALEPPHLVRSSRPLSSSVQRQARASLRRDTGSPTPRMRTDSRRAWCESTPRRTR